MTETTRSPARIKKTPVQPNKSKGYVKSWREEIGSPMYGSGNLFKVWMFCRWRATHTKYKTKVPNPWGKIIEVELEPGQFVFGKYSGAKLVGMAPSTFYRQIRKLQELGEIILRADRTHTVATIVNWGIYEGDGKIADRTPAENTDPPKGEPHSHQKADRTPPKSGPHSLQKAVLIQEQ
jgi:hypothetical protein